eukprot:10212048-Heterocapsa_arctica.AAC.1
MAVAGAAGDAVAHVNLEPQPPAAMAVAGAAGDAVAHVNLEPQPPAAMAAAGAAGDAFAHLDVEPQEKPAKRRRVRRDGATTPTLPAGGAALVESPEQSRGGAIDPYPARRWA